MLYGVVESVKRVECIKAGLDYLEVTIDFDCLPMFGDYSIISQYIGKHVQYDTRLDMYQGRPITVIANLANVYTVQTVEAKEHMKLIPLRNKDRAVCTIDISSLKFGDIEYDCIGFLCGYKKGESSKAQWIDCDVVDKFAKVFTLRIFTKRLQEGGEEPEDIIKKLVGHYIKFTVRNTNYGYQTDGHDIEIYNVPVIAPPEVEIAILEINKVLQEDEELRSFVEQYDLIQNLKGIINYELGYHLVEIAAELRMISTVSDITEEYEVRTLQRAAIASRVCLLPSKTKYSKVILNVTRVLKSALKTDKELLILLDVLSEEDVSSTKRVYIEISKFVQQIIAERRGVLSDEEGASSSLKSYANVFGRLL